MEGYWRPTEKPLFTVRVCINKRLNTDRLPSCAGRGSRGLADALEREILAERIPVSITRGPCMNNCANGPTLKSRARITSIRKVTSLMAPSRASCW